MPSLTNVLTPSGTGVGSEVRKISHMIEAISDGGFGFARRVYLLCLYNNKSIAWPTLPGYDNIIEGFSCTMVDSQESDRISLDVDNRDFRFLNEWHPQKGQDTIVANLYICHWQGTNKGGTNFPCGQYTVDDFRPSGGENGNKATIEAVSIPPATDFRTTPKTKTWEEITLFGIVNQIAANNGLVPFIDGEDINIESIEQSEQTDSEFLLKICEDYGFKVKVYWNRIVVYDADIYEAADSVETIDRGEVTRYDIDEAVEGTYTGARLSYTNKDGETVEILVGNAEPSADKEVMTEKSTTSKAKAKIVVRSKAGLQGTSVSSSMPNAPLNQVTESRILKINQKVSSESEGERIAIAKLNEANRGNIIVTLTMPLDVALVPALNVTLHNFGVYDGKYGVKSVTHTIGTKSTTKAKLYRIPAKFG